MVCGDLGDDFEKWMSGVVVDDRCLYCFPHELTWTLKFNRNDDTVICVGEIIEGDYKFSGIIKAKNGCMYDVHFSVSRVAKFYVTTQNVTYCNTSPPSPCLKRLNEVVQGHSGLISELYES